MIQFIIPGQPQAKGRPRFRIVRPNNGPEFVNTYTDSDTVKNEARIAAIARDAMSGLQPLDAPLEVLIELRMQIPVSWSKKRRVEASEGKVRATKKPDIDNVVKSILDASNGIVWIDDAQVVVLTVRKLYHADPCVMIGVRPVEGELA